MRKTFTLTIALTLILTFNLFGQNGYYYHSPKGKEQIYLSTKKILIKFVEGVSIERQHLILNNEKDIAPLIPEMQLPAPKVVLADLQNTATEAQVWRILSNLNQNNEIVYANPVFAYGDGTLQAVQEYVIIRLKTQTDEAMLKNIARSYNLDIVKQNEFDRQTYHLATTKNTNANALTVANELYETGVFDYVEPDFLRFMKKMMTNDPAVNDQWALNNTGQSNGTPAVDMRIFDAWMQQTGNASIKVAILDEGVDINHPDLLANLEAGYDATGQGSAGAPSGNDAHGTACAGIVGAVGNNGVGMAGVAYGSRIIPVRIAYTNAEEWVTSNTWIGNAINWSWQNAGADILSNSWGGGGSSFTIDAAINNAVTNGRNGLGAPVLFAAGNDNAAISYPATNTNTIAVGAISMCDERKDPSSCDGETWWGSNFGEGVDVAAPGTKIYATDISGSTGYNGGDYVNSFNGTSSATPNAAGVMALILSSDENLTEEQARFALESTCEKVGNYAYQTGVSGQPAGAWSSELGYGRINAMAAITAVAPSRSDDAGIMLIQSPNDEAVCANTIAPVVVLRNNGVNVLTSVKINYQVDNSTTHTYNWVGSLSGTQNTQVTLPNIPVNEGVHILNVFTSNPNGQTDTNASNDGSAATFSSGSQQMTLRMALDNYGTETSWKMKDTNGNVLQEGGPYQDNIVNSEITELICLPAGCFDFIMYDAYGDGMCCGYGNGSFRLVEDATGNVLASGGQYGSQDLTSFCIEGSTEATPLTVNMTTLSNVLCYSGNEGHVQANVQGGASPYSYTWSADAIGETANNLSAGAYTLKVTDAQGEIVVTEFSITQPDILSLTMIHSPAQDGHNGYAAVEVSGGTSPYEYAWNNGASTPGISGVSAGTYEVTIVDDNGCSKIGAVAVESVDTPALEVKITSSTNVTCNGEQDGTASAEATGGFPPYTFVWNNQQNGATATGFGAGYARVVVIDSEGNQATAQETISEPPALVLTLSIVNADNGNNGAVDLNVSGGTAPYTYAWSNGATAANLDNMEAGLYYLTVTDANSCAEVATANIEDVTPEEENTLKFEHGLLSAVSENWETITVENDYTSMVVIASVRMPHAEAQSVVARVRNAAGTSFEIKIQIPGGISDEVYDIDYMVIEEGVYNVAEHGVKMEAVKTNAAKTARSGSWTREARTYHNQYENPVVLGQIMTANNEAWSVFWASTSTSRSTAPTATSFAAGKNVAEDFNQDRADETIGYLVVEEGQGNINGLNFQAGLSDDVVKGISNTGGEGMAYEIEGLLGATVAVISTAGMDGNNGGWPALLNAAPVSHNKINLTFSEDQIKDEERSHTTEQAAFIVFEDANAQPEPIQEIAFEQGVIEHTNGQWTTIELENTYNSMVVVATVVQKSRNDEAVVTRIKNANGNSFQIKVQAASTSGAVNSIYSIHYMVAEEGVYTTAEHGVTMEVVKVSSTQTSAKNIWKYEYQSYQNDYSNPVIFGQVMTYNDSDWSVFWSSNGYRKNPATAASLAIGKHVGEDTDKTRSNEMLGYIVMEQGVGLINGMEFIAGLGADIVVGIGGSNGADIRYDIEGAEAGHTAVLSAAGMDGSDCGWPILYGDQPVADGQLALAFDEDQMKDAERSHTTEQVSYIIFNATNSNGNFAANQDLAQFGGNDTPTTYLSVYPNPTVDVVNIQHEFTSSGDAQIIVSDMMGRTVLQEAIFIEKEMVRNIQMDVKDLDAGHYIISIILDDEPTTEQFIKTK